MANDKHLTGRTAIVSGATRGIGRAIALKLAQEGANVAFNYLNNKELAGSFVNELETYGVKSLAFKVDVRDFDKVQKMKDAVLDKLGPFDILINNAGITKDVSLVMMSPEDWNNVVDSNLKGTFNMTKAVIFTLMKQKRGDIINISSLSGINGIAGQTNYSASKGGIIAFTKSLAKEVASLNIRVNAIAPGTTETEGLKTMGLTMEAAKAMGMVMPMGRMGQPDDIARVALFLASDQSSWLTGERITASGGQR